MASIISVRNVKRYFKQYKKEPGLAGSIKSLFKREHFEIKAVDGISFEIEAGEMIGFIGPNGAGKTTTLKMLSGLLHPSGGEISVLDFTPYDRRPEFQKQFSLVMGQKAQLWWDLPAMDSLILNKEIYDVPQQQFDEIVEELSSILDIKDILKIQVRKLSLGQRMKCELLAALVHQPKVLFLDEPTIGLDVVVQKKIRQFFKEYNQKYQTTVLLTSHYMDDVKELCKRLIIIDHGKLIYDGSLDKIVREYAKDKYLGLTFEKEIAKSDLEKYGKVNEYTGLTATISVKREDHTRIAGDILNKFAVDDLDIQEPELEDIISQIFTSK
jgi:ABC-2 type transport system ATP-binding protein